MVYDIDAQKVILFGGYRLSYLDSDEFGWYSGDDSAETWAWNGNIWEKIGFESSAGLLSPSKRSGHAMIYDAQQKKTILYGGAWGGNTYDDMWALDMMQHSRPGHQMRVHYSFAQGPSPQDCFAEDWKCLIDEVSIHAMAGGSSGLEGLYGVALKVWMGNEYQLMASNTAPAENLFEQNESNVKMSHSIEDPSQIGQLFSGDFQTMYALLTPSSPNTHPTKAQLSSDYLEVRIRYRHSLCPDGYQYGGGGDCVEPGSCSEGYHNGGNGDCLPEGTCSGGYHNGGNGDCVEVGSCAEGYHNGGIGDCVAEGSCSENHHNGGGGDCATAGSCSDGYHDSGTGDCVGLWLCASGYHDGGNEECVPEGTCSVGYHNGGYET
ncbi:MAG TPA: hypothetical protein EYN66_07465, partial [Myxococcales bacterium]|nr:hypothetical protein [Myxococcales bacterium]